MTREDYESFALDMIITVNASLKNGLSISGWEIFYKKIYYTASYEYQNKKGYDELFVSKFELPESLEPSDIDDMSTYLLEQINAKVIRYFGL